ncbi:MAG TPA: PEGA domain-containing protein [Polyangiaceae bacterium]|nr:PEGA domain-containing protein [Polyangiaceae bacterium]
MMALSLVAACAFMPYPAQTVSLRVQGNVADAQVTVDDIPLGALGYVAAHGVALPPGRHRVTIEKAGYFPWDAVLEATDEPINLQVTLVPIPD